jgi:hypothetical protein
VIVITSPGRSGTSFLALLYRELGFDPGGEFHPHLFAGVENRTFTRLNVDLASALGTVPAPRLGTNSFKKLELFRAENAHRLPGSLQGPVARLVESIRYRRNTQDLMDWSKLPSVVAERGEELRRLAEQTQVVKDPRFCWTLCVWLASGAAISSVVVPLRPLDAMVESRVRAGMIPKATGTWAKNNFAYGIGLLLSAIMEYRVPLTLMRFPDFLTDSRGLYQQLPLPEARTWDEFNRAFEKVHDASLVHDQR